MTTQQPTSQNISEISRILQDIKLKTNIDMKERLALELREAYQKYFQYSDEVFQKILKLICSSEFNDKLSTLSSKI